LTSGGLLELPGLLGFAGLLELAVFVGLTGLLAGCAAGLVAAMVPLTVGRGLRPCLLLVGLALPRS
jgi:hypothetical protein